MPKFMLVYHGGRGTMAANESDQQRQRFMAWMGTVGSALLSPANPVKRSKVVSAEGVTDPAEADAFNGYSVVEAADLDAAIAIAQTCPFLEIGTLEVAQLVEMSPTT